MVSEFCRQIGAVRDQYRAALRAHPDVTFATTVDHIFRAIRKLAAVQVHQSGRNRAAIRP